jgi:cellulose biosynthesis protein BcsQ
MNNGEDTAKTRLRVHGRPVPIVAFYSASGGVGKSTLARKVAELVTAAAGRGNAKPNVLLVDMDVESNGLTFRLTQGYHPNTPTVHEILGQRSVAVAQAMDVTTAVSLASGSKERRGRLYLVPGSPPDARGIFDTLASIDRRELIGLLKDLIEGVATQYDISCVVIDCAPGANPYTAAAATLADIPIFIGRNEQTSYEGMRILPERFREWYPEFQPASQRAIVNAVAVAELYKSRSEHYQVLDYIPLVTDVILEVEGLARTDSFRMILFEKYVIDIIKQIFVGMGVDYLIPDAPEVLGQEWLDVLTKLDRCEEAPSLKRLHMIGYLRWVGAAVAALAAVAWGVSQVVKDLPAAVSEAATTGIIAGLVILAIGWYAENKRHGTIAAARELAAGGPDEVMKMLAAGPTDRKQLDQFKKLADSIPNAGRR